MKSKLLHFSRIPLLFLFVLTLLSACQTESRPNADPFPQSGELDPLFDPLDNELPHDNSKDNDKNKDESHTLPTDSNSIQISNSDKAEENLNPSNGLEDQAQSKDGTSLHPKNKEEPDFLKNNLSLLGMKIHDSKTGIILKFGMSDHSYIIEDSEKPITVYDYDYFSVGFDPKHQLEFIEIRSRDIDPMLNGLLLGDNISAAHEALGEPDSSSNFVLSYRNSDAILKLDIDPSLDTILSIKLFSVN